MTAGYRQQQAISKKNKEQRTQCVDQEDKFADFTKASMNPVERLRINNPKVSLLYTRSAIVVVSHEIFLHVELFCKLSN